MMATEAAATDGAHSGGSGHAVTRATVSTSGKTLDLHFADGGTFRFHAAWLRDSTPSNVGQDEYRTDPQLVYRLPHVTATAAHPVDHGTSLEVTFAYHEHAKSDDGDGKDSTEEGKGESAERFDARFLHASAPFVGKPLVEPPTPAFPVLHGTGTVAGPVRVGWMSKGFTIPEFDFEAITASVDSHIAFMECVLFQPGVAFIRGVPAPESLSDDMKVGVPLESAALKLVGRLNQHTNRSTRYSVTHAAADAAGQTQPEPIQKSMDYNCAFKLPMHTDHSQFPGMPGYLQFMQNLQGGVASYVTDGLAVAEYIETHHPDEYTLLTTVPVTHSFRNRLYKASGAYRDLAAPPDPADPVDPYEVCHTHPVIELSADGSGRIERIAQSETKRGVCAIPFDVYEPYMAAYRRWTTLIEDPRFVHRFEWPENGVVVCNNYRVLHGRADLAAGDERTLIVGYSGKSLTDNRYRMLCQQRAERDHAGESKRDSIWMSRLPNQVLSRMVVPQYGE